MFGLSSLLFSGCPGCLFCGWPRRLLQTSNQFCRSKANGGSMMKKSHGLPEELMEVFLYDFPRKKELTRASGNLLQRGSRRGLSTWWHTSVLIKQKFCISRTLPPKSYAAPIRAFFCSEIRAFTGFWGEISSTVSKFLVTVKNYSIAVNGR